MGTRVVAVVHAASSHCGDGTCWCVWLWTGDWRMTLDLLEAFTKDLASRKGSSDPPPASSLKRPAAGRSAAVRVTPEEEQLLKRAYTVAITACGRVGQWQMAVELMSKMLAQGKLAGGGKQSRPMALWHSVSTTWGRHGI